MTSPNPAHWTPAKQRIFLMALADTGNVVRAARAAGMTSRSAHRLRAKLSGTPFDRAWSQAIAHAVRMQGDPFDPLHMPARAPAARAKS
ncbi:LysR family transcriptional regulator [Sphingobium phenoxybenzoativorans]|uniref:LysR family transcriptional regulator n=1 Tax=Sphingobium phenoxybenzoativorans TaxID=1592790 RepID=A0A975KB14_9SPHN|nr:LysR family transcriptional regulator [Sphingobium phenoxybenzoativorans]